MSKHVHNYGLLLCLGFLFLANMLQGQSIEGQIVDVNGAPLIAAHCRLQSSGIQNITDTQGRFKLPCTAGEDTLHVSFVGYEPLAISIASCPASLEKIVLKPSMTYLGMGVEINAERIADNTSASQTTRMNSAFIKQAQAGSSADLLQESGSLYLQKSQQGGGSPIMRGMEANRILLLLDGLRLNNAIFRAGHLQQSMTIDQYLLEEATAYFGPNSLPYGSDAMGGVINFKTFTPSNKPSASYTVKAASATQEYTAHAHAMYGKGKIAALSSLTFSSFGSVLSGKRENPFNHYQWLQTHYVVREGNTDKVVENPNPYKQFPVGYTQLNATQKVVWSPSETLSHQINVHYTTSSDVPRYDRLTQDADGYYAPQKTTFAEWYYGPQERLTSNYGFEYRPKNKRLQLLKTSLLYQEMEESRVSRKLNNQWKRTQTERVHTLGAKSDAKVKIGKAFLDFGAEAYYDRVASSAFEKSVESGQTRAAATRYPNGGDKMLYTGAYATLLGRWKQWRGSAGGRLSYTYLEANFADTTFFRFPFTKVVQRNPSASGSLNIARTIKRFEINAVASTAFRAPNVDDVSKIFDSRAGNSIILPNATLRPEQAYNLEMGVSFRKNAWRIQANAFHNWIHNLIQVANAQYQGKDSIVVDGLLTKVQANSNIGRARIYGWSAQANFAPQGSAFGAQATITQTFGRNLSNQDPLGHIPPIFGKVGMTYKNGKWNGSTGVQFNGWKRWGDMSQLDEDRPTFSVINKGYPAWVNWQMRLSYAWKSYCTIQLGIDNILDYHYRTFSSGVNAPGRNFMLTIRGDI